MRKLLFFLLLSYALALPAHAQESTLQILDTTELEQALPDAAEEIYGNLPVDASAWNDAAGKLLRWIGENALPVFRHALDSATTIMTILLLCAAAESVADSRGINCIALGGALGISAVAAGDVSAFIGLGQHTVETLSEFCTLLLPCIASAGAAAGNLSSSGAMYAATALFMDVLLTLSAGFIMPLIYVYIAAVTARAALGTEALSAAVRVTQWTCTAVLTVLVTVFTAYFGITGAVGAASDAASARVAKAAINAALPVVGKIVSGAAGSVIAGASLLRAGIGVFGLLTVLAVCAYPFLALGAHYLVYKAAALLGAELSGGRLGGLISGIGTAFGMVLGLVGVSALMLFFALISGMKAVSPL